MNWRMRIAAKVVLSRLPVAYGVWRNLSLFRHGRMDDPAYAHQVFIRHFQRYQASGRFREGYRVLEIGPGDTLNTALIACAYGAGSSVLIDTVAAASDDLRVYRSLIEYLSSQGLKSCIPVEVDSLQEILLSCSASYFTTGLAALREQPAKSIDFIFSHAVLEHVRAGEFNAYMDEMHRILRPDGFMSHRIDFKDHLGGGLNNMRFASSRWEHPPFVNSGFYTNRLRANDVLAAMRDAGLVCTIVHEDRWDRLPIKRCALAPEFAGYTDAELCVSGMDVTCIPSGNHGDTSIL